ncbi:MAG TPA: type I restriction endonuclease [Blastocatellia bacterium]|nr:type I restriction endonuclease [Blastocatellia bacterium]HMX25850.1 type I restriction endonuclease [Blastocatellia bacterium]HMZ19764.1 type I restriction endonuclease [Blastocatellia bacterium]HNG29757.1 type I restriction endonuclease [Blastocatellia bacterium]
MSNRPAIPTEIENALMFECRYRCACCCEPTPLERAHIIPWSQTHDHSFENLVVLCKNCHGRSHAENWPDAQLRRFKQQPCALERDRLPVVTSEQKAMIDFIAATNPDALTEPQRLRLAAMFAAYAGVQYAEVRVIAVAATNSSLIRLEMPRAAAERLIAGFQAADPRLVSFLDDFAAAGGIKLIETARPTSAEKPPVTNTKEAGLETLIFEAMTGFGWIAGHHSDYDREYAVDLPQLAVFLQATQEETAATLQLETDGPERRKFLAHLQGEITRRGTIDVMRKGLKFGKFTIDLFYGTPSPENLKAVARHAANRFSITRQLHYSRAETQRALDLALFINGLPIATFELKNSLTKQTVEDAVEQYKRDRDPRELLFSFGRCVVHFALDDHEAQMCTELKGAKGMAKDSWFLPFNQGWNDGAGNPPNPYGIKTDYLWRRILTPGGLTDILENYAQIVEVKNEKTGKKKRIQIFPRYHQLDVVRKLLADAAWYGAGKRYLIQHSAGSGKSNSIAWLAHQLIGLRHEGKEAFDSIIVITDRRVLDKQIRETIKGFAQVSSIIGAVKEGDGQSKTQQLSNYLRQGKKIIISTVQTFPFVLDRIGEEHRGKRFAIIIDEAHSSQGGRTAAAMNVALSEGGAEVEEETTEDKINRIIENRKLLPNASYFAFTATPKNKTLELFGVPYQVGDEKKFRPFHSYTMKQAIQEGFILDVLKNFTPVESYYRLAKTIESDPEFDVKKARKKLRRYVESHQKAIGDKAEIMVDHFLEQVIGQNKIGGQARAMVVTGSIQRAIQYFFAFRRYLEEIKSPYKAIVAFSGEPEYEGVKVSEASLNGFSSREIEDKIQEDPYRFLICADKFQTGYDEPLLHTMYVDKPLSSIKAVQTLSRLNRAHPKKHDVFVLDFQNNTKTIEEAFADYYRTTVLSNETDPNKLHTLKAELDGYQVYAPEQVERLVEMYLNGADRDQLDPILDACVAVYVNELDEDGQVDFKGKAKVFARTYDFLAAILPYGVPEWEKLSIFLNFLISKLPAPIEEDLSKGILEAIDMDSYRAEKKATMAIALPDAEGEIDPVPTSGGGRKPEAVMDKLSNIIKSFNEQFGSLFSDTGRMEKRITEEIPTKVSADKAYQNAKQHSDRQNARIEHDKALARVVMAMFKDEAQLVKQFQDNESFRRWLMDTVFGMTYDA